jgi:peptide/nickel transport system permease protein
MLLHVIQRLVGVAATLVVASIVVFLALSVLGGDPAASILGTGATPTAVAALRKELGLDAPLVQQYFSWIGGLLHGDLGNSIVNHRAIAPQLVERAQVTLPLTALAMTFAFLLGVPAGVVGAARNGRLDGATVSVVAQLGLSLPAFWVGLMLVSLVSVKWRLLPVGGFVAWGDSVSGALESLLLPALSIGLVQGAWLQRYVRSAVLETTRQDFIRTARSKGMTSTRALWSHGLRNAALPLVTVLGIQVGMLLGGTVVIENVYFLPGMGSLVVDAVGQRDLTMVRSVVLVLIAVVVLVNFTTDLLYGILDPRSRRAS